MMMSVGLKCFGLLPIWVLHHGRTGLATQVALHVRWVCMPCNWHPALNPQGESTLVSQVYQSLVENNSVEHPSWIIWKNKHH